MIVKAIKDWIVSWLRFAWLWFLYIVSSERCGLENEYENNAYLPFPEKRVVSGRDVYMQTVLTNSAVKPVPKKEESKRSKKSSVNTIVRKFEKKPYDEPEAQEIQLNITSKTDAKQNRTTEQVISNVSLTKNKPVPILCKRSEILGHGEDDDEDLAADSSADNTDSLWEELVAKYAADESAKECDELKTRLRPRFGSMERTDSVKSEEDISRELDGKLQKYLSRIDDDYTLEEQTDSIETREIEFDLPNVPPIFYKEAEKEQIFIIIEDDSLDTRTEEKTYAELSDGTEQSEFGSLLKSYETEINLAGVSKVGDDIEFSSDVSGPETIFTEKVDNILQSLDIYNQNDEVVLPCDSTLSFLEAENTSDSSHQEFTSNLREYCSIDASELLVTESADKEMELDMDSDIYSYNSPCDGILVSSQPDMTSQTVDQDFAMLCRNLVDDEDREFDKIIACYIDTNTQEEAESSNCTAVELQSNDNNSANILDDNENHDEIIELSHNIDSSPMLLKPLESKSDRSINDEKSTCEINECKAEQTGDDMSTIGINCFEESSNELEYRKDTFNVKECNIGEKRANGEMRSHIEQTTVDSHCEIVDSLPEYNLQVDGNLCQDALDEEVARDLEVIECDARKPPHDHYFAEIQDHSSLSNEEQLKVECTHENITNENLVEQDDNVGILETPIFDPLISNRICQEKDEPSNREEPTEGNVTENEIIDMGEKKNDDELSRQIEIILKELSQVEHDYSDKNAEQRLADKFSIDVSECNDDEESVHSLSDEELSEKSILHDIPETLMAPNVRCSSPQLLELNKICSPHESNPEAGDNLSENNLPEGSYNRNSKFSLEDIPEEIEIDEQISSDDDANLEEIVENEEAMIERKCSGDDDPYDGVATHSTSQNDIPEYLNDMKDLLIPRARRKKAKKFKELEEILRIDAPMVVDTLPQDCEDADPQLLEMGNEVIYDEQHATSLEHHFPEFEANTESLIYFTEEEKEELQEISKEQAEIRASQRRELEKYLSMPGTLTKQEETELQEWLAEEESEKIISAASEARLMAFLTDVRNRLGYCSEEEDTEDVSDYLNLPMSLTKDEEELLSDDGYEVTRTDFATDDEYKEYIKAKYLQELEEDRLKVEEQYVQYEDDYEYEYSYDEDEAQDASNESFLKDQAVGTEDISATKKLKKNKIKNYISLLKGSSSKSPPENATNPAHTSPREPLPKDRKDSGSSQSKFFRYGSLGKKRKRVQSELTERHRTSPNVEDSSTHSLNELDAGKRLSHISAIDETDVVNKVSLLSCKSNETDAFVISNEHIFKEITDICSLPSGQSNKTETPLLSDGGSNEYSFLEVVENCPPLSSQSDIAEGIFASDIPEEDKSPEVEIHSLLSCHSEDRVLSNATLSNVPLNSSDVSNSTSLTSHETTMHNCSDSVNPLSEFSAVEIEQINKAEPESTISFESNFVLFPLRNIQNFQLDGIYLSRSNGDSWRPRKNPSSIIDHMMSTGKDRRILRPEVDGMKSPMLDEFEKIEQEVEEADMKNKTNGVDKKRKDGEKKKKKKKKKTEAEKENKKTVIQTRDVIYEKHVGPRIRSFDTAKMKSKFNKPKESTQVSLECHICGKPVFQMEKVVAEKASWHKNCFRCSECSKQLTTETYQSHEGTLYCKPHFKELFRPKAVIQDEDQERKDRLLRRPRMIILESQPDILPDDVVRATAIPDYGLDELQSLNVQQRFSMFENADKIDEAPKLEHISVQRSQSLMSKAARFYGGEDTNGIDFDEEDEDEMNEESDDIVDGEVNGIVKSHKKKERPMSFSGIGDLKNAWEQKQRREEMTQARKEEVGRFRQLLCAGKNNSLKEMFESGKFDSEDNDDENKQKVMIEVSHAAKSLRERFEKGQPFIIEDDEERNGDVENSIQSERQEVDLIFKEAETAKQARNVFKQIDSIVAKEGAPVMRSKSFAQAPKENRISQDVSFLALQMSPSTAEVIKAHEKVEDFQVDTTDLASRFKFFSTYEKRLEQEQHKSPKIFRITPPREGVDQVEPLVEAYMPKPCMAINCAVCKLRGMRASDDIEVGRDPNLIKCTDKYEDDVDCKNTKNILQMFRQLEMAKEEESEQDAPRPLKSFTPPPEGENYTEGSDEGEDDEEYSDEDYTDEDTEEEVEKPKYKDEILEMLSAKKAANLRAKFERYESEIERRNSQEQESEECRPSLDTARNLRAMFENKAVEEARPLVRNASAAKINRFV